MRTATTMGLHCIFMSVFLLVVFAALFMWLTHRPEFKPLRSLCSLTYISYIIGSMPHQQEKNVLSALFGISRWAIVQFMYTNIYSKFYF